MLAAINLGCPDHIGSVADGNITDYTGCVHDRFA
jgi:hypothetical protein